MNLEDFTDKELRKVLKKLKNNKAAGPDGTIVEMIKILERGNRDEIRDFLNQCWDEKKIPEQMKEANIACMYKKGNTQDLADDEIQLTVDKANAFAFKVDDIEERQGHINFETLATSAGAYTLKDTYDSEVLSNIQSQVTSGNTYGADHATNSIDTGFDTDEVDPVNVLARLGRLLDDGNVPTDNRWAVAAPRFFEELQQNGPQNLILRKILLQIHLS